MNHNTILALLAKLDLIERDKAEALAEKLSKGIQPARFKEAEQVIKDVFDEIDKRK